MRKLKLVVDVALIYVCKAFLPEMNTLAHLRHCQDSSNHVKSRHLSAAVPAIPGPIGAGVSNDWCIT